MEYQWRTGRYCVFKNFCHLVFVTKYRKEVLTGPMLSRMKEVISHTCCSLGGELLEFGGEGDHIHLMVSIPPKIAASHFVGRLKGCSSYWIRKEFKAELRGKLWGTSLWSPSYCLVSCGGATLEIVRRYIAQQRVPSSGSSIRQSIQESGRKGALSRVAMGRSGRS